MVSMIIEEHQQKWVTVFWKMSWAESREDLGALYYSSGLRLILIFSVLYDFLYFFRCFSQNNVKQNFLMMCVSIMDFDSKKYP